MLPQRICLLEVFKNVKKANPIYYFILKALEVKKETPSKYLYCRSFVSKIPFKSYCFLSDTGKKSFFQPFVKFVH